MSDNIRSANTSHKGVVPRVAAAFSALTMMVACAVPGLIMPQTSYAAEAGICAPENIDLGDNIDDVNQVDTGIATWVGRDMYVGGRPAGTNLELTDTNMPSGSYAAEAEGLTMVRGKLAINKLGNSWSGNGFRIGAVGFGAMFRPENGSKTLGVGGLDSNIKSMNSGGTDGNVGAWNHGAFVGKGKDTYGNYDGIGFTADITGNITYWNTNKASANNAGTVWQSGARASVVGNAGEWDPSSSVTFNTDSKTAMTVGTTDYTGYTTETLQPLGKTLGAIDGFKPQEGDAFTTNDSSKDPGIYYGEAPNEDHWRNKYNDGDKKYKFEYGDNHKERLITFNGDGTSLMQVFNIPASALNSDGYSGLDFAFANIPENASVLVNVVGSTNVTFHNGWRFWWNGNEIGNGYYNGAEQSDKDDYNTASQAIMWNFQNTPLLTIYGGDWNASDSNRSNSNPGDDPAAAMLGSIIVPNGSFDDHVTTNGRVWVGQDLMINNPKQYGNSDSASAIGMDQERHNFPWSGNVSTTCSTISWTKVDESGDTLGGSQWGVYKNLADAQGEKSPLYTVTDNNTASGDWNPEDGKFRVDRLTPDADYYIRELTAPEGYQRNDIIYVIRTTTKGDVSNKTITAAFNSETGAPLTADQWKIMNIPSGSSGDTIQAITNPRSGGTVEWGKHDGTHAVGLPGSVWTLTLPDGSTQDIVDNTKQATSVQITQNDINITGDTVSVQENETLNLKAVVLPDGAPQDVTWESSHPEDVGVQNGHVVVSSVPENGEIVTITAKTVDTNDAGQHISASIKLTIVPIECENLTVKYGATENPTSVSVGAGKSIQLTATTTPENLRVTWTSDDPDIATVDDSGKITGVSGGTTTITAQCKDKVVKVSVTVTAGTTIYINWTDANFTPQIHWWGVSTTGAPADFKTEDTKDMTAYTSCGTKWWYYTVPVTGTVINFNIWNPNNHEHKYWVNNNGDIKVDGSSTVYTIEGGTIKSSAPSCAASASVLNDALEIDEQRSDAEIPEELTVNRVKRKILAQNDDQVVEEVLAVNSPVATSSGDTQYTDQNSKTGQFMLTGLPAGDYSLQEKVAPSGYWLNPTVYQFNIGSDGKGTWKGDVQPSILEGSTLPWIADDPTQAQWFKVDATSNEPLEGSSWHLDQKVQVTNEDGSPKVDSDGNPVWETGADGQPVWKRLNTIADCVADDASGCTASSGQTYYDIHEDAGTFVVAKLPTGTFRISEAAAPEGYVLDTNFYEFSVSAQAPEGKVIKVTAQPIGNSRKTGTVQWAKVSSEDTTTPLPGSVWSLTFVSYDKKEGSSADIVCSISDSATTCKQGGSDMEEQPAWADNLNSGSGQFSYANLPWGTYTLVETKAPDGYYMDSTPRTFVIGPNSENAYVFNYQYTIENTPGVILPATGGDGINMNVIYLGVAIVAASMIFCAIALRKQQEQAL